MSHLNSTRQAATIYPGRICTLYRSHQDQTAHFLGCFVFIDPTGFDHFVLGVINHGLPLTLQLELRQLMARVTRQHTQVVAFCCGVPFAQSQTTTLGDLLAEKLAEQETAEEETE